MLNYQPLKHLFSALAFVVVAGIVSSCNSTEEKTTTVTTTTTTESSPAKDTPPPPEQPEAETLMSRSDCGTCHQANARVVGPSYKEIAAKYPNEATNVSKLAQAIIKGGMGNWGTVPMPPHACLAQADAEKMTGYILSLRDK